MRTQQVGLGRHDFGVLLFGLCVSGAPQVGLTAGHVQKVFPSFGLKMLEFFLVHGFAEFGQRAYCVHDDGTAAFFHLKQHQVVTQTGRGDGGSSVGSIFFKFSLGSIAACKSFTKTIEGLSFEQEEPCAHRTVTVFETGRGETVFHHGQLCTDSHTHSVGGA